MGSAVCFHFASVFKDRVLNSNKVWELQYICLMEWISPLVKVPVSTLKVIRDQRNEAGSYTTCFCIKGVRSNPRRDDAAPGTHNKSLPLGQTGWVREELLSKKWKSPHRQSSPWLPGVGVSQGGCNRTIVQRHRDPGLNTSVTTPFLSGYGIEFSQSFVLKIQSRLGNWI